MKSVIEFLHQSAKRYGEKIAIKDNISSISYSMLLDKAYAIGAEVNKRIGKKNNLVLIFSKRNLISVVAMWGVLASQNYYANIDINMPKDRIQLILEKTKPKLIICTEHQMPIDTEIPIFLFNLDTISAKQMNSCINTIIDVDPAYLVFTSGSTGIPKAVVKSHRSIVEFTEAFISEFELDNNEILGNQADFDFDVSAKDIFLSARLGATMCIIPKQCFLMPKKLVSYLIDNDITTLIWAASAVKYLYKIDCLSINIPNKLRNVFFSGESMPYEVVNYWKTKLPNTRYVNLYAPSEVTGNCLYYVFENTGNGGILPLEHSFSNVEVLILNEKNKKISEGEKGQIYVRGSFVGQGYYKEDDITGNSFIQNPCHNDYIDLVYKTGDFVLLEKGKFYFVGRVDNQFKHMGHRIELEEIENAFYQCGVGCNVCVVYDNELDKIVLLTDNSEITLKEIVLLLKNRIPKYMIPNQVIIVEKIILNNRGKVDRGYMLSEYKKVRKVK